MFSLLCCPLGRRERLVYLEGIVVKIVLWVEVQAELSSFQHRLVVNHLPLEGRKKSPYHIDKIQWFKSAMEFEISFMSLTLSSSFALS